MDVDRVVQTCVLAVDPSALNLDLKEPWLR
jgi:hypothetical protein